MSTLELVQIGTLFVALVGAVFAFLNLQNSATQKIAAYRLQWIQDLRADIAEFCGRLINVLALKSLDSRDKSLAEIRACSICAQRLMLRLNLAEEKHRSLKEKIEFLIRTVPFKDDECAAVIAEIGDVSRAIFKEEWDRVRSETKGIDFQSFWAPREATGV